MPDILTFDATASNIDGTDPGSSLSVGPGTSYRLREAAFPAPPVTALYAGSIDTDGSALASQKHENRQINLTILCETAAALRSLQAKAGKIKREGGTLKWTLPASSETVIFDLLAVDAFEPQIDAVWHKNLGAYCDVRLSLTAAPYGRGASVQQADRTETTLPALVFTETGIKGDMPAWASLLVDNDSASAWMAITWGRRTKHYSSASTAALYYEAEACTMSSAATAVGPAGASGGGSNTAFHQNVGTSGSIGFQLGSGAQTHIGEFRVYTRVQLPSANSGITSVQLLWAQSAGSVSTITNDYVSIVDNAGATVEAEWVVLDLGLVSIPKVAVGTQSWLAAFQAKSTVSTDDIYYDWVALVPAEQSGRVRDATHYLDASDDLYVRTDGVFVESNSGSFAGHYLRAQYEGDLLTVPPAGAESRTNQFIVLPLGSNIATAGTGVYRSVGVDDVSARLTYQPRYLVVPEP